MTLRRATTARFDRHLTRCTEMRGSKLPTVPHADTLPRSMWRLLAIVSLFFGLACGGGAGGSPVGNAPPRARLAAPVYAPLGQPVVFDAAASFDPDGTVLEYTFTFSDGSRQVTLSTPEIVHTFEQPGAYDVAVVVRDDGGHLTRATQLVVVIDDVGTCDSSADCSLGAECRCSGLDCETAPKLCYETGAGLGLGAAECAVDVDCGTGLTCRAGLCLTSGVDSVP